MLSFISVQILQRHTFSRILAKIETKSSLKNSNILVIYFLVTTIEDQYCLYRANFFFPRFCLPNHVNHIMNEALF